MHCVAQPIADANLTSALKPYVWVAYTRFMFLLSEK